jgi:LPS export ABC transporter protein LptC
MVQEVARRITAKGVLPILFAVAVLSSCDHPTARPSAPAIKERDSLAMLQTQGITSLISDSGITKYRIKTRSWDIYDRTRVPRWVFERGLQLEEFDRKYKVVSTLKCDTAYYYTTHRVWELLGHVQINNVNGQKISGSQLFWDESQARIYSNRPFTVVRPDKTIHGASFWSNQDMTIFHVFNTDGHIAFDENRLNEPPPPRPTPPANSFMEVLQ